MAWTIVNLLVLLGVLAAIFFGIRAVIRHNGRLRRIEERLDRVEQQHTDR